MVVNFKAHEISRGTCKLIRTIKLKKYNYHNPETLTLLRKRIDQFFLFRKSKSKSIGTFSNMVTTDHYSLKNCQVLSSFVILTH